MKRIFSGILSVIFVFCLLISSGCDDGKVILHEGYEEFEDCIYQELAHFLSICQPEVREGSDTLMIDIFFREDYLKNAPTESPQYMVIDRFLWLYDNFVMEHPGYFGEDQKVSVEFFIDRGDHTDIAATLSNYHSYNNISIQEETLISAVLFCPVNYDRFQNKNGIVYMDFLYYDSESGMDPENFFVSTVGLFPDLRYVHVNWEDDGNIEARIVEQYPYLTYES